MATNTIYYRGYVIVYDDVAADIWQGENWICQEGSYDSAKTIIDTWMVADYGR